MVPQRRPKPEDRPSNPPSPWQVAAIVSSLLRIIVDFLHVAR